MGFIRFNLSFYNFFIVHRRCTPSKFRKINMMQVVEEINKKTSDFSGMKVPVKVIVDISTREFEVEVGTPPTTALIKDELKIEKGSQDPGVDKVADLKVEQALKIARMKFDALLSNDYKMAAKEVIGTCVSMQLDFLSKTYPEIKTSQEHISNIINLEEKRYGKTTSKGKKLVQKSIKYLKKENKTEIPTDMLIKLYDSHVLNE